MKLWVMVFALLSGAVHAAQPADKDPEGPYKKLDVFSHVLSLIENNYVENADETKLLYGAIEGMVRTLDPHSSFMDPKTYSALKEETEGEYGGVGLELETRSDDVVVVAPIGDTPASRAGFAPGDKLLEIDGVVLSGWHEGDAVRALLGPPGTKVVIKAMRASWSEPRSFTLLRDVIRVVSVESKLFDKKFGYVKIKNFQDRTDAYLKKALDSLRQGANAAHGELAGVVLDLRHNPGGLLDQGVKVADRFLESGVIVTTKGRGGRHVEVERAHHKDTEPRYPMVVLVDGGTASASEIVAGALQDHGRAVVIGTQSYGKGSVQTVIELEDGSGLKLTIARYYTPSGRSIQERGITPDVWVKASGATISEDEEQREQSLPGHFKGETVQAAQLATLKPPVPQPATPDDPKEDAQLKVALDTLRTWQMFKQTLPREPAVRAASAH
jgi:carboxyl-terminal processing protease